MHAYIPGFRDLAPCPGGAPRHLLTDDLRALYERASCQSLGITTVKHNRKCGSLPGWDCSMEAHKLRLLMYYIEVPLQLPWCATLMTSVVTQMVQIVGLPVTAALMVQQAAECTADSSAKGTAVCD